MWLLFTLNGKKMQNIFCESSLAFESEMEETLSPRFYSGFFGAKFSVFLAVQLRLHLSYPFDSFTVVGGRNY